MEYTALGAVYPRQVQFRYKLDGVDDDWVFELTIEGTSRALQPTVAEEVGFVGAEGISNAFRHAHARTIGRYWPIDGTNFSLS